MKRVPLRDLRAAFRDPRRYAKRFTGERSPRGKSKYSMFLHSIAEFHRNGDLQAAQEYLREKIENNFKDSRDLADYSRKLQVYAIQFRRQGNALVRARDNITVPLPTGFPDFAVSGQAGRIDLVPSGGYAIWVFVRDDPDWRDDPRMPLLEYAYADKLGVPSEEILVGVYDFDVGQYSSGHFTRLQINAARAKLKALLRLLKTQSP